MTIQHKSLPWVILALLLGCGLRRQELAQLKVEDFVEREDRAVIVDLVGKGRRVRRYDSSAGTSSSSPGRAGRVLSLRSFTGASSSCTS